MTPGTDVKALRNKNGVEIGKKGVVVPDPKGNIPKPSTWVWVKFEGILLPKLMLVSEVEVVGPIDYIL